jgi:dTDP-4-amino-4,6-dideoxygalactose transaminase
MTFSRASTAPWSAMGAAGRSKTPQPPVHLRSDLPALEPTLNPATSEPLRFLRPELPPLEDLARYYALSEEQRLYSNGGPCYERFAARLAEYVGGDLTCLPVGNCTLGLMAALRVLCGEPAPERRLIAVPSFTFTASACAIKWAGFEPLFVDIDAESWQLDPAALREALHRHHGAVAGVLGCSTFGTPAASVTRQAWRDACADHELPLLIDSAAGFGARDDLGRRLGGQGDTEVFSFHATKPFAIGEGGAVVTADPGVDAAIRKMINFGLDPSVGASVVAGFNAKLSELHCAMGLAMLDRFDEVLAARRGTATRLQGRLSSYPLRYQDGSIGSTWQGLQVELPSAAARQRAVSLSRTAKIEARTYFDPPLHQHPAFASAPRASALEITEQVSSRSLSLPMANALGPRQVERVVALIAAVFADE